MMLPHFDVVCDTLLDRGTAKCNLFGLCNKEGKVVNSDSIYIGRCICRLISYFKEPIFFACIV